MRRVLTPVAPPRPAAPRPTKPGGSRRAAPRAPPRCAHADAALTPRHSAPSPRRVVGVLGGVSSVYLEALAFARKACATQRHDNFSNRQAGLQGCRTRHELSIGFAYVRAHASRPPAPSPILVTGCQALAALSERERPTAARGITTGSRTLRLRGLWLYYGTFLNIRRALARWKTCHHRLVLLVDGGQDRGLRGHGTEVG